MSVYCLSKAVKDNPLPKSCATAAGRGWLRRGLQTVKFAVWYRMGADIGLGLKNGSVWQNGGMDASPGGLCSEASNSEGAAQDRQGGVA